MRSAALWRMLVPDFVGIGTMRSGTTWMYRHLDRHPDVAMARRKEVHYFDRFLASDARLNRLELGRRWWYGRQFVGGNAAGQVTGEFTPNYCLLDEHDIKRFRRMMPRVKLLFSMRDPVERAWSHIRKDLLDAGVHPAEVDASQLAEVMERHAVAASGGYATLLRRWSLSYPREQMLAYYYEDIVTDPVDVLARVFGFLGLDVGVLHGWNDLDEVVNDRPDAPIPDAVVRRFESQRSDDVRFLREFTGRPVPWSSVS